MNSDYINLRHMEYDAGSRIKKENLPVHYKGLEERNLQCSCQRHQREELVLLVSHYLQYSFSLSS